MLFRQAPSSASGKQPSSKPGEGGVLLLRQQSTIHKRGGGGIRNAGSSSNDSNSKELLFWSKWNNAIGNYCLHVTLSQGETDKKLATVLIGEELEWLGAQSFLFMAQKFTEHENNLKVSSRRSSDLENAKRSIEIMLNNEIATCSTLRKQIRNVQLSAEDNEWQMQEQLAQINSMLQSERDSNADMKKRLQIADAKIVEVEMYLSSDRGVLALQMEEELATSKLRIGKHLLQWQCSNLLTHLLNFCLLLP